jgi:ribonuclease VapC
VADPERYTLDTSAVVAYFENEPGADQVEGILRRARTGGVEVNASFMTFMEMLYRVWNRRGEEEGKAAYLRLKALPLKRVEPNERLLVTAARIKASHPLSVADAWIAATARITSSTLVHKDPEFKALGAEVAVLALPFKAQQRQWQRHSTK